MLTVGWVCFLRGLYLFCKLFTELRWGVSLSRGDSQSSGLKAGKFPVCCGPQVSELRA